MTKGKMTSWHNNDFTKGQNDKILKWQVDRMISSQNDQLAKWQVDRMSEWHYEIRSAMNIWSKSRHLILFVSNKSFQKKLFFTMFSPVRHFTGFSDLNPIKNWKITHPYSFRCVDLRQLLGSEMGHLRSGVNLIKLFTTVIYKCSL